MDQIPQFIFVPTQEQDDANDGCCSDANKRKRRKNIIKMKRKNNDNINLKAKMEIQKELFGKPMMLDYSKNGTMGVYRMVEKPDMMSWKRENNKNNQNNNTMMTNVPSHESCTINTWLSFDTDSPSSSDCLNALHRSWREHVDDDCDDKNNKTESRQVRRCKSTNSKLKRSFSMIKGKGKSWRKFGLKQK